MVKKINEAEFSEVKNSKFAVVDFNATWCGPCKMLGPVLEEVSEELSGKAEFFAVDVDENQTLAIKNKIQSIPAIVVFKDGEPVDRQIGFIPKAQLIDFINRSIS
ncbi:MAG: thioredoxin [Lachnospiraceae bacterium]|jgi:thioredoxin|nr:MAG: thioredoxin [Lachnospiraceae bacterium]